MGCEAVSNETLHFREGKLAEMGLEDGIPSEVAYVKARVWERAGRI